MNMKLKLDLPVTVNDMSDGELAKVILSIKKLVDDLNFILENLEEENLGKKLRDKIQGFEDEIKRLKGGEIDETS